MKASAAFSRPDNRASGVCPVPEEHYPGLPELKALVPVDDLEREVVQLYMDLAPRLFRYGVTLLRNREGAQDALQETFLRYFIWRTEGHQIDKPKAWLFRVLRNQLLDMLKAASIKKEVGIESVRESPDSRQDPETHYRHAEISQRAQDVLAPRELECLRLRAEGLRYEEIAEILAVRSGTVGAMLARAQKKIRRAIGTEKKVPDTGRYCTAMAEETTCAP